MGFGANRQRFNGNELLEPVCQHIELYFRFCGSLYLRLVVQPGWLRLRLEAFRCRPRLVSVRLWQLVHGPVDWRLGFLEPGSVGLAPLSLWRLDLLAGLRMDLAAIGVWRRPGLLSAGNRGVGAFRPDARDCAAASGRQEREGAAEPFAGRFRGRGTDLGEDPSVTW